MMMPWVKSIFTLVCGIFVGILLANLWKEPYHGFQVTVSGAVAAGVSLVYLLWTKRTPN